MLIFFIYLLYKNNMSKSDGKFRWIFSLVCNMRNEELRVEKKITDEILEKHI